MPRTIENVRCITVDTLANRFFGMLFLVTWVSFSTGCSDQKSNQIAQAVHRRAFFPSVSPESVLDYQFYYQSPRGGYLTCARLILTTNVNLPFAQEGFELNILSAKESEDRQIQQVFIDLLHASAATIVGGTNIPVWMRAREDAAYHYLERKNELGDQHIWLDTKGNTIYFTAIGANNSWVTNTNGAKPK